MLPDGFSFQMTVLPNGPSFSAKKTTNGELAFLSSNPEEKVDLSIGFKQLTHSFLVLSFQESTSKAFANDRMMVNGDISYALRVTRILNSVETFILPKLLAERTLKETGKVAKTDLSKIADMTINDGSIMFNPKEVNYDDARTVLDIAWA